MKEGDRRTKSFHNYVKKRRRKSTIHGITIDDSWETETKAIESSGIKYFESLLNHPTQVPEPNELHDVIPKLITEADNDFLTALPSKAEIKNVVFGMKTTSVAGVDGFDAKFFQAFWDVVEADVYDAIILFFQGATLPRGVTSTAITLVAKNEAPTNWSHYRPISLCTVVNKIISKTLTNRLSIILPKIISLSQGGFVRGRDICHNTLLAQEMVHSLNYKTRGGNAILKIDMAKAFDRVSWSFIKIVMERFGFSATWIDYIMKAIGNCWFSLIINGEAKGFFKSSNGIRQGDPISPSLFILAQEYLLRSLDMIAEKHPQMVYCTGSLTRVTALSFADDLLIFCNGSKNHVKRVSDLLAHYEEVSGQVINKDKSFFIIPKDSSHSRATLVSQASGFSRGRLPFTYLGIPLHKGGKKIFLYDPLIAKIRNKIAEWDVKLLSYGGRLTLIQSVLYSYPMYYLASMKVPETVLERISKIFNRFLWSGASEVKKISWKAWEKVCSTYAEGGLAVRSLQDLQKVYSLKMWYHFRKQETLWAKFMMNKYCKWHQPLVAPANINSSIIWKRLVEVRDEDEADDFCFFSSRGEMYWKPSKDGKFSFKETWKTIKVQQPIRQTHDRIWQTCTPKKCSFLCWRVLNNLVPVDSVLKSKGIPMVSKCQFCLGEETMTHLFFSCPEVKQVWWHFASLFNVHMRNELDLKQMIFTWLMHSKKKSHITSIIPVLVLWVIWEGRNKAKHQQVQVNSEAMIMRVIHLISMIAKAGVFKREHWEPFTNLLEHFQINITPRQARVPKVIAWSFPPTGFYKLNVDGGSRRNPGASGGGGILRDSKGDWLCGFKKYYGNQTSLVAELRALLDGLTMCINHQIKEVQVCSDSRVMINMVNSNSGPWYSKLLIEQISKCMHFCKATLQHSYRECNAVADKLANLAMDDRTSQDFIQGTHVFNDTIAALLSLEKQGVSYIRQ